MEITTVRFTVPENDQVEITFDDASTYNQPYNEIRYRYTDMLNNWEQGKTEQWVADEVEYDAYTDIMLYDPEEIDPETEAPYPPPYGWNSEEDVVASQEAHDNWVIAKADWEANPDNDGIPYPVVEPTILLRPSELPVVPAPVPAEEELVPNTITPYDKYYGKTLADVKELSQNQADTDCSFHILEAWSKNAQSNVSLGLYEQTISELCKSEISSALAENKTYVDDIEALTTNEEIDAYMESITRTVMTGGRDL